MSKKRRIAMPEFIPELKRGMNMTKYLKSQGSAVQLKRVSCSSNEVIDIDAFGRHIKSFKSAAEAQRVLGRRLRTESKRCKR